MNALLRFSGLPMVTGVLFIFAKNITGVGQGNLTISTIHARANGSGNGHEEYYRGEFE